MTIAVRINDAAPSGNYRRRRLYEILGTFRIYPYKVKNNNNMYFVIIDNQYLELILSEDCKKKLNEENYQIHTPLEYTAMRTIVVRQLDQIVDFYTDEEIVNNIQATNDWCKVESVYKFGAPSKLVKVRMESPEMAQRAMLDGLYILNQKIPARNIEREIYIKVKPCYNCYSYNHITKECNKERQTLCAFCAQSGHRQGECNNRNSPKCINCDGEHRTLAAICPVRKKYIKEKSKKI